MRPQYIPKEGRELFLFIIVRLDYFLLGGRNNFYYKIKSKGSGRGKVWETSVDILSTKQAKTFRQIKSYFPMNFIVNLNRYSIYVITSHCWLRQ